VQKETFRELNLSFSKATHPRTLPAGTQATTPGMWMGETALTIRSGKSRASRSVAANAAQDCQTAYSSTKGLCSQRACDAWRNALTAPPAAPVPFACIAAPPLHTTQRGLTIPGADPISPTPPWLSISLIRLLGIAGEIQVLAGDESLVSSSAVNI
jgi:hypothetical protein